MEAKPVVLSGKIATPQQNISDVEGYTIYEYFSTAEGGAGGNNYPERLLAARRTSPTNGAIISLVSRLVRGKDMRAIARDPAQQDALDNWLDGFCEGRGLMELIHRTADDYKTFGSYAWALAGLGTRVIEIDVVSPVMLRKGWYGVKVKSEATGTEEEALQQVFLSRKSWEKDDRNKENPLAGYETIPYLPYSFGDPLNKPRLFFRMRYSQDKTVYPLPDWVAGLQSAEIEAELINFTYAATLNGFSGSGVIDIPGVSTEQLDVYRKAFEELRGSDAAGSLLFVTSNSPEQRMDIKQLNQFPSEKDRSQVAEYAKRNIINAHSLPSGTLIGEKGGSSLGGDGGTIETGLNVLMEAEIKPLRNLILRDFKRVAEAAGYPIDSFEVEDIEYMDETREDTLETEVEDDPDDDNPAAR